MLHRKSQRPLVCHLSTDTFAAFVCLSHMKRSQLGLRRRLLCLHCCLRAFCVGSKNRQRWKPGLLNRNYLASDKILHSMKGVFFTEDT